MKQFLFWPKGRPGVYNLMYLIMAVVCFTGCRREPGFHVDFPPSFYSADVIDKWMTLETRIYKSATGFGNGGFARPFAYSGISAYESIDPGLLSWKHKYNGLSGLPETDPFKKYNWPASVNATLAEINRGFFTSANLNATDLAAIDSLENALYLGFSGEKAEVLSRSVAFGKSIADAIFAWAQTDGFTQNNAMPYTPPVGFGLWVPTSPTPPVAPFWGNDRRIIANSGDNDAPGAPIPYSEDPGSDFYKQVNDLYQASKVLTTDQKNQALFWRDVPGVSTPGHWMSITQQAIRQSHSRLDKAAGAYALTGICLNDAVISVFHYKYIYLNVRPITYIHNVIGDALLGCSIYNTQSSGISGCPCLHFCSCCRRTDRRFREYRTPDGSYLGLSGIPGPYVQHISGIRIGRRQFQILCRNTLPAVHRCRPQIRNNRRG